MCIRDRVRCRIGRDIDDEGRVLWIPSGKTKNAKRRLKIPEHLRPLLLTLLTEKQMCSLSISFLGLELRIVRTPIAEHRVEDAQQLPHARNHRDFEGLAALP